MTKFHMFLFKYFILNLDIKFGHNYFIIYVHFTNYFLNIWNILFYYVPIFIIRLERNKYNFIMAYINRKIYL